MFTVALLYASSSNYAAKMSPESFQTNIVTFLSEVQRATADPFKFSSFHTAIRQPFDYYKWYVCVCSPLLLPPSISFSRDPPAAATMNNTIQHRGNDFLRPLVILEQSKVEGLQNADKIAQLIAKGDNVIIMSNHQTEADPQVWWIRLRALLVLKLHADMIVHLCSRARSYRSCWSCTGYRR